MSDTATPTTPVATGTYVIDPTHSRVGFVARHAMVTKVRGQFLEFEGTGVFDERNPTQSTLNVVIDVASIDTRNPDRDQHLRTNDFFDIAQFPQITFASTSIEHVGGNDYKVHGDLTIKGVTRPMTFDVEVGGVAIDPYGMTRFGLDGTTVINRKDFGITWNANLDSGGVVIGEKVTLEFEVSAVKQS